MTVAAIIPTIPTRAGLLEEALASVETQTRPVDEVCVVVDEERYGPAHARNRAARESTSEWLAFLDDDDLWFPNHIEVALSHAAGADVVYTDCELVGPHNHPSVNQDFDPFTLTLHNYIPVTALVRRDAFMDAGMFDTSARFEDWQLWQSLAAMGARFVHVPITTWQYRYHGDQRTFEEASHGNR